MDIVRIEKTENGDMQDSVNAVRSFLKALRKHKFQNAIIVWISDDEERVYYHPVGEHNDVKSINYMLDSVKLDIMVDPDVDEESGDGGENI